MISTWSPKFSITLGDHLRTTYNKMAVIAAGLIELGELALGAGEAAEAATAFGEGVEELGAIGRARSLSQAAHLTSRSTMAKGLIATGGAASLGASSYAISRAKFTTRRKGLREHMSEGKYDDAYPDTSSESTGEGLPLSPHFWHELGEHRAQGSQSKKSGMVYDSTHGYHVARPVFKSKRKKRKLSKFKKLVKTVKKLKPLLGSISTYTTKFVDTVTLASFQNFAIAAGCTKNDSRKVIYDFQDYWSTTKLEAAIQNAKQDDNATSVPLPGAENPSYWCSTTQKITLRNMAETVAHIQAVVYGAKNDTSLTSCLQSIQDYNTDHGYATYTLVSTNTPSSVNRGNTPPFLYSNDIDCHQKWLSHVDKTNDFKQVGKVASWTLNPGDKVTFRYRKNFKYKPELIDREPTDVTQSNIYQGCLISVVGDIGIVNPAPRTEQQALHDFDLRGFKENTCVVKYDNGLGVKHLFYSAQAMPTIVTVEPREQHEMQVGP